MPDPHHRFSDAPIAAVLKEPEPVPHRDPEPAPHPDSSIEPGQENRSGDQEKKSLQVFHSYQGASWIGLTTLLLSWVLSLQTFIALVQNLFGEGTSDWGLFQGVSAWFSGTLEGLWTARDLSSLIPCLVFSVSAVWLLDRRSRTGLRTGVAAVLVYLGGTWYAEKYTWYPDWAAWHGEWNSVQIVALFSVASFGILSLIRMGNLKNVPQWRIALCVLPASSVVYGILLTSTNAAF
jgi:hypothetical protein